MGNILDKIIIGKNGYPESSNERKQVLLSGQYALLALITILIYASIELYLGKEETIFLYTSSFILIASTLVLHRKGLHTLANYILFSIFNVVVYLVASSEDIATGACIFFIPVAMGSAAIFNYSHRKVALGFAILSFILCGLAFFGFNLIPYRTYSEEEMNLSIFINLLISFPVSMMAIYLLIRMSHYNATQLVDSNKQMIKLNEELDRFVYSTSHDLRAPLLSLLGLLKLAESATPEEGKQYHKMMHNRVQNLDKFIKDITDYSRNNRLLVVKEMVHPKCLVNEIWESLRYSIDAQGIEFINDIPEQLSFENDNARLRVILGNLIANAIRYHDQRKEYRYIRVSTEQTIQSISLKVEDNGQGIDSQYQAKVFEMFFRGNESSQGSGLGLYIVKETLAKLSASISLTSIPKEGSTFQISFPS